MSEYTITMRPSPELSEAEKRRRISRVYSIIIEAGRRARAQQAAGDEKADEPSSLGADEVCPERPGAGV